MKSVCAGLFASASLLLGQAASAGVMTYTGSVLAAPAVQEARWLVLEQDRVAVTRAELEAVRDAEARNRELVLELGGSV